MHIAEGIITGVPAVVSTGIGFAIMAVGAQKMKAFVRELPQHKPLLGMAGAFIFLITLMAIPAFTGTCTHPCGTPLAGILLGPWIGMALSGLTLVLQAAFFSHGGFSSWGVNLIALGVGGAGGGWLAFSVARRLGAPLWLAGGLGGLLGNLITYTISGLVLAGALAHGQHPQYNFPGYLDAIYTAYLPTVLPIAIGEMFLTGLSLQYIEQRRPEVLAALRVTNATRLPVAVNASLILFGILALSLFGLPHAVSAVSPAAPVSTQRFAGMDDSVNMRMAAEAGRPAREPYLDTQSMGDLWNTLLLLGGAVCGFVLGRSWDSLFGKARAVNAASKEGA